MSRRRPRSFPTLLLWLVAASAGAQMQVEVIPLQHRFPDDVIPVIRPLLATGGSVTGMNNQLVVKTTPGNLAEIRAVLDSIDRKLRRLRISVRQDADRVRELSRQSVSGRVEAGDVTLRQQGGAGADGVTVGVGDRDSHLEYRRQDRATGASDRAAYQVQALEGQPAFIRTGQTVPVPQRTVTAPNGVIVVQDTVAYHDADSGFWVLPRLSGEVVTLLIAPRTTKVNAGVVPTFDVQGAETTVSGRLGQWIDIGGISQSASRSSRELPGSTTGHEARNFTLQVRVEEIP